MQVLEKDDAPSADTLLQARNGFEAPMSDLQAVLEKHAKKATKRNAKASFPVTKSTAAPLPVTHSPVPEPDDAALETMIHDFLQQGRPSSVLLDFVRKLREKKRGDNTPAPPKRR